MRRNETCCELIQTPTPKAKQMATDGGLLQCAIHDGIYVVPRMDTMLGFGADAYSSEPRAYLWQLTCQRHREQQPKHPEPNS